MKLKINIKRKRKIRYGYGEPIVLHNTTMRVGRSPHKLKIPLFYNSDLAYLSGYHLGDGYLEDINKTLNRNNKGGYEIDYADKDKNQVELINKIINKEFNYKLRIYNHKTDNKWMARGYSKAFHWFLNKNLEIPYGRKCIVKIPAWIYYHKNFLRHFISGFFDAEGDISRTINKKYDNKEYYILRIQLAQKDKNILLEIQKVLEDYFSIKSYIHKKWNQNGFSLIIKSNRRVKLFYQNITF